MMRVCAEDQTREFDLMNTNCTKKFTKNPALKLNFPLKVLMWILEVSFMSDASIEARPLLLTVLCVRQRLCVSLPDSLQPVITEPAPVSVWEQVTC